MSEELTKRCYYFVSNNTLYKKTVEVHWDPNNLDLNKVLCSREIYDQIEDEWLPTLDVSPSSVMFAGSKLSIYNVRDDSGNNVRQMWDALNKHPDKEYFPPGAYELLYLHSLTEKQFCQAITKKAFYDIYHNPATHRPTASKALASLLLLEGQGKLDYIMDMQKYMHWFMMNCYNALEYIKM